MTREEYQNRVLGCFVGKNIGGTLGMPMEWERSKNDVTYYTHDITGDPLPNDDLDIPTSVRISGHAYFREIRKRQQNMLLRMRLWIMETERASMQKYSWQPWRVQPFMKGISVS